MKNSPLYLNIQSVDIATDPAKAPNILDLPKPRISSFTFSGWKPPFINAGN